MKKILMVFAGAMSAMVAAALPSGYTQVEYIESTKYDEALGFGGQYIDTGYVPTPTTRIVADFNPLVNYGGYLTFFGAETGGDTSSTGVILRYADRGGINGWFCNARSNEATLAGFFENTRIAAELKAGSITLNGQTAQFATTGTPCQLPIYIFCCNDGTYGGGWARRFQAMRLYSFKIYEGDVLKRDFVPCVKTTTGESGLWDENGAQRFVNPLREGVKGLANAVWRDRPEVLANKMGWHYEVTPPKRGVADLLADLKAVRADLGVVAEGLPETVFLEVKRTSRGDVVHLVNFDPTQRVEGATLRIPAGARVTSEEPFGAAPAKRTLANGNGRVALPAFAQYLLVSVEGL